MSLSHRNLQPVLGHSVEDLVKKDHPYRVLLGIIPFEDLCRPLKAKYSDLGRGGYPVESMFKALLLQWMENLSYREIDRFLQENLAGKLFCGFTLTEETPDYSTLCTFRDRVGIQGLANLFNAVRTSLQEAGLIREVFTFVDATKLISKISTWNERDKAIEAGYEKLSNENVSKFATDPEARFGKNSRSKWYGYKFHVAVDMSHGLISRISATPANVEDTKGARHVLPRKGSAFGDKAYSVGEAAYEMRRRGIHSFAIFRDDMKGKNREKDRWLSGVRMPYEGTFAQFQKRARYRGLVNCQFQAFMQALAHNCKRLIAIGAPPLVIRPQCA